MTTTDPTQPGYRPDAHTDRQLGDVGHGDTFGAALYDLYVAGRVHYPELAAWYAQMTTTADTVDGHLEAALNGALYRQGHQDLVNLHSELQLALYRSWEAYDATGPALVVIADDYLATDDGARTAFDTLMTHLYADDDMTAEEQHERAGLDRPADRAEPPPKPSGPVSTGRPVDVPRHSGGPQA